jgi:hypothetical protein
LSIPDQSGLGLTAGVSKVEDEGKVSVVDGDTGDVDETGDSLLEILLVMGFFSPSLEYRRVPWILLRAAF